jgi:hypothetical protein
MGDDIAMVYGIWVALVLATMVMGHDMDEI